MAIFPFNRKGIRANCLNSFHTGRGRFRQIWAKTPAHAAQDSYSHDRPGMKHRGRQPAAATKIDTATSIAPLDGHLARLAVGGYTRGCNCNTHHFLLNDEPGSCVSRNVAASGSEKLLWNSGRIDHLEILGCRPTAPFRIIRRFQMPPGKAIRDFWALFHLEDFRIHCDETGRIMFPASGYEAPARLSR